MVGPPGEQRLEHTSGGALSDRHAARDPDHVRHPAGGFAEERVGHTRQIPGRRDMQVEQAGEREVHLHHFLERELLVEPLKLRQIRF
jgi:hypothetical protein